MKEEGQNVVEHEVSSPCFWVSALMGFLIIVQGGDGLSALIFVAVVLTRCQDFFQSLPFSRPFASKLCELALFSGTLSRCPSWYLGNVVHVCAIRLCQCPCT